MPTNWQKISTRKLNKYAHLCINEFISLFVNSGQIPGNVNKTAFNF